MEIATGAARRVSTSAYTGDPVFSPDAKRIVYGKAYGRPPVLAILSLQEGLTPAVLPEGLPEGDGQQPSDWSPDGGFILETSIPRTHFSTRQDSDIFLVDTSQKHSAHGPEIVKIHYPFHPLHGQSLRVQRRAKLPKVSTFSASCPTAPSADSRRGSPIRRSALMLPLDLR